MATVRARSRRALPAGRRRHTSRRPWRAASWLWPAVAVLALLVGGCEWPGADTAEGEPAITGVAELVDGTAPSVVSVLVPPGQGSGVIYHTDGLVVTNAHVALQGEELTVAFADGRRAEAELVAADERGDLAVLEVDVDRDLPVATFREELPHVGEFALALGSPLGLENSATAGIISGLDRSLPGAAGMPALAGLIQTDAGLSPGNSGGALVDADGAVVGINVAAAPPEAGAASIGFAIPSAVVVDSVEQLVATGEVRHPFLGVQLGPLTPAVQERFDVAVEQGALVLSVAEGSPADDAGVEPGDVLVALGDDDVTEPGDLLAALRQYEPGEAVTVTVDREGEQLDLEVTLDESPE